MVMNAILRLVDELRSIVRFDQLSYALLVLLLISVLANNLLSPQGTFKIHPLLLGRQSDIAKVRRKSESPIISSVGSMDGFLPVSPQRSINSLYDLVAASSKGKILDFDGKTLIPSGTTLAEAVSKTRKLLQTIVRPQSSLGSSHLPEIFLITSHPDLKLTLVLAAATLPVNILIASSSNSGTLSVEVQEVLKTYLSKISLVICDEENQIRETLGDNPSTVQILTAAEIMKRIVDSPASSDPENPKDRPIGWILMVDQPQTKANQKNIQVFGFTSESLLAGITASLGVFPMIAQLDSGDRMALQFDNQSHWGYTMSFAAAALYAGADVCFFTDLKSVVHWQPTVLLLKPDTVKSLSQRIKDCSNRSIMTKLAMGRRLQFLSHGSLLGPLGQAQHWIGPKARAILTDGPVSQSTASLVRAGLGCSLQRIYSSPIAVGPILCSHAYDFQILQAADSPIHCGPPTANIECKMIDVPELAIVNSDAVKGQLVIRGPSVAKKMLKDNEDQIEKIKTSQEFYLIDQIGELITNGTIRIHAPPPPGDF